MESVRRGSAGSYRPVALVVVVVVVVSPVPFPPPFGKERLDNTHFLVQPRHRDRLAVARCRTRGHESLGDS
ncbi:hypothetical protein E2C01_043615 [Portunus trituberculatus]|uniref:Uncharacterized protein n=1 Tax=Portunus trituberculatus TaxID=210409 RepID=A0A5B7FQQ9_PORTR|nr:hypothetical protein [Portunus trituberculatus]